MRAGVTDRYALFCLASRYGARSGGRTGTRWWTRTKELASSVVCPATPGAARTVEPDPSSPAHGPRQAARGWWWHRPDAVARAAQGAPDFVRPPVFPQRMGCSGATAARAGGVGRRNGRTTPSCSGTGSGDDGRGRRGRAATRRPVRRTRTAAAVRAAERVTAVVRAGRERMCVSSARRATDRTSAPGSRRHQDRVGCALASGAAEGPVGAEVRGRGGGVALEAGPLVEGTGHRVEQPVAAAPGRRRSRRRAPPRRGGCAGCRPG